MKYSMYGVLIFLWIVIFIILKNRKSVVAKQMLKKRKVGSEMRELAKKFIGKDCILSSFDGSHRYDGVIKEVSDSAVLLEKDGKAEAVNLDYVIRIREYPKNKNGKKKSGVFE